MKLKKIIYSIYAIILLIITMNSFSVKASATNTGDIYIDNNGKISIKTEYDTEDKAFNAIIDKYKTAITFFSGIAAISMVAIFIAHLMKLGATSSNPQERQKVIIGLLWSGFAAAGLGSVSLVVGIFYGLLGE